MSARSTSKSTRLRRRRLAAGSIAVVANVPVDQFEIVDGPTRSRVLDIKDALKLIDQLEIDLYGGYPYVDQEFTLLTAASSTKFGRTLKLARIFDEQPDDRVCFTALHANQVVSGWYNPTTRKGWFSLD